MPSYSCGSGVSCTSTCSFEVGDRIKNVGKSDFSNPNRGKKGVVMSLSYDYVQVQYDDGGCDSADFGAASVCYQKINKSIMKTLNKYITKLVDADTRALCEAGYLNGDLEPTQKAFDTIAEINFFANKAELIARATQEIADEKAKK